MKKLSLILLLQLLVFNLSAQDLKYGDYDWDVAPKIHTLKDNDKNISELILKDKTVIEFTYGEKGAIQQYKLLHRIVRVNSDEAIKKNNRIYVPFGPNVEFLKHKARVVSATGSVKVLSESDIKEAEDVESKARYRFFAFEGIDIGSEIEYFYLMKLSVNYRGAREIVQDDIPKRNVEFELVAPENLQFKIKSYNGLPEAKLDSMDKIRNVYSITIASLEALKTEELAANTANLQQLIYKLSANTATGNDEITSYANVADNLYKSLFVVEKSSAKKVKKFIEGINLKFSPTDENKIRTIEEYIKGKVVVIENNGPKLGDLDEILKNKVANEEGIIKLFAAVFNELKIEYQIVLTCNRNVLRFDPDFPAYNFLTDYLMYFPTIKKFMSPAGALSCLGFVPSGYINNYGLFISEIKVEKFQSGLGQVKFIDSPPYDQTYDHMDVVVETDEDFKPTLKYVRRLGGYYAQHYQPYYSFYPEADQKKITESIMKTYIPQSDVKEVTVENEGRENFGVKPFIVKSVITSDRIIEKAGNKYLFKIGELIGPQMEMYQKEQRKQDIESNYTRSYHRVVHFKIPEGYKIANPQILNMDVFHEEKGNRTMAFTSKYTIEGQELTVTVDEYYKEIRTPVALYEQFRKVINAAADFNKLTLFIQN